MLILKKKDVLKELAFSLYLMLEFDEDTTALSLMARIRKRALDALKSAAVYTGTFSEIDIQTFLDSRDLKFTIDCGNDIVIGDIIRFIETVMDNRKNPPRNLGKRGITAEVLDIKPNDGNPTLLLRVITCGGVWDLKPETKISRTLRVATHFGAMRIAWDDEAMRAQSKSLMTKTSSEASGRYGTLTQNNPVERGQV